MLSDEMTTGSVTSDDHNKRLLALRSHGWNLSQQRFKEAFPDERGKADIPPPSTETSGSASATPPTTQHATQAIVPKPDESRKTGASLGATWGHILWDKWRDTYTPRPPFTIPTLLLFTPHLL
ncbi:hypothetical protein H0H93_006393 [Arthromyces matolae]|nr:hypothetical protein H0H93_006393 [Arthromyces matolae]